MSAILLPILVPLALLSPLKAGAQAAERPVASMTARGRFMPGGTIGAFLSNDEPTYFSNYGSYANWNLSVAPSLVYFVRDGVGIGISGAGGYQRGELAVDHRFKAYDVGANSDVAR